MLAMNRLMTVMRTAGPLLLLLVLCWLIPVPSRAEVALGEHFRLSGFATLGMTRGGNDVLGFRRDLSGEASFDGDWDVAPDSLIGVQLDAQFNDDWRAAIQLVGKDRLVDSLENSLEWAFLAYRINPDWTVRLGRIGLDVFMLSEYRNLGFSFLWARPPVEYYTPIAFESFDGMDITWSHPVGEGLFRAKLFGGATSNDFGVAGERFELELKPIVGTSLSWESERWLWRFSLAQNKLDQTNAYFPGTEPLGHVLELLQPIWPEAAHYMDYLYVDDGRLYYTSVGMAYTNAPWQVQSELSYIDSKANFYPSIASGYISVGHQFGPATVYGVLATVEGEDKREEVPLEDAASPYAAYLLPVQQAMQFVYDSVSLEQHSVSLGVRWDLRYDLALKAQWDHSWVQRYGTGLWQNRAVPDEDQQIDTYSINLNCIF